MQEDSSEVIDARYTGGIARFANHACRPNCVVERWEVAGEICCGLFADCDIAGGDEITFNYGRSPRWRERTCFCGAADCTGMF
jgi:SET domain-containing protein